MLYIQNYFHGWAGGCAALSVSHGVLPHRLPVSTFTKFFQKPSGPFGASLKNGGSGITPASGGDGTGPGGGVGTGTGGRGGEGPAGHVGAGGASTATFWPCKIMQI